MSYDFNHSLNICRGLRPEIIKGIMPEYTKLMKQCWIPIPIKDQPLMKCFEEWKDNDDLINRERIPVPGKTNCIFFIIENESVMENHPLSC